jgi:vacuolar-type H+-ATPase subunit I/STV1
MSKELVADKDLSQIEEIQKGVGDLTIRMSAIKVKTQAEYQDAIAVGKEASKVIKDIETAVKAAGLPYKTKLDKIKAAGKAIVDAVETGMDDLRDRCKVFIRAEEVKKQKELAALEDKRREEERKMAEADTAKEQTRVAAKVEKIEVKMETVAAAKTENSLTFRKIEVVDENLVPREYLSVDLTKIRAVQGKVGTPFPVIPGVRIWDDKQVKFG